MDTSSSSNEKALERLMSGKLKAHKLEEILSPDEAVALRRKFIGRLTGVKLKSISEGTLSAAQCKPNIENMIGTVQIPIAFAGPLTVEGKYAKGDFYLPLATTEGALCASINRGCKLLQLCGGVQAALLSDQQTRSILLEARDLSAAMNVSNYIEQNQKALKEVGQRGSNHLKIQSITSKIIGRNVFATIFAATGDAMGMNMITIAGMNIGVHIESNLNDVKFLSESANMCTDKKPSALNLLRSRGKSVIAQARLSKQAIKDVMGCTAKELVNLNYKKNLLGSAASASLGFNAHFANVVSAVFAATGQDMAHVVEGSLGFTSLEIIEDHLIASATMPSLQVGTVGGGTGLPCQAEALSMMGVKGPSNRPGHNSRKLAEIICAGVLAGELSLLGAQAKRSLAKSHERLNR